MIIAAKIWFKPSTGSVMHAFSRRSRNAAGVLPKSQRAEVTACSHSLAVRESLRLCGAFFRQTARVSKELKPRPRRWPNQVLDLPAEARSGLQPLRSLQLGLALARSRCGLLRSYVHAPICAGPDVQPSDHGLTLKSPASRSGGATGSSFFPSSDRMARHHCFRAQK